MIRPARTALLLLAALPLPAIAQDAGGFNAHGFVLSPERGDVRDAMSLYRPGKLQPWEWSAGGLLEYANRPLVYVTEREGQDPVRSVALNHLLALHVNGTLAVHERLRFGLTAPVYATSTGFDGGQGASLGDIRLDALAVAREPALDGVGLGVVGWLDLPTGSTRRFLGRRALAGGASAIGTYEAERVTLTGNLGLQLEPGVDIENIKGADLLLAGGGASYLVSERTSVGLEALLRASLSSSERAWTGSPAEAILSVRHRDPSGGHFLAGLAAPLSQGVGAAAFRVFLGGGFGRLGPPTPRDRDGDGIPDKLDACPDEPETFNSYIDEDGCPDALSTLRVVVEHQGQPVQGADIVVISTNIEERATTTSEPWTREVVPDTMWQVDATLGACLQGQTRTLVGPGVQEATVQLALVPAAVVRLRVTDEAGQTVPGARLVWDSPTPECLPEPPGLDRTGAARVEIGAGQHKLIVGAPGYRVAEVPVFVERGDEIDLDIQLRATKLRVEKKQIVILDKVQFEFNKAKIKPESFDLLSEVAEVIVRNPQAGRVEVQGHTDNKGRPAYNLDLSQRRADAVRDYLIERGVPAERLLARGFGLTVPIATNDTEAGRALNRRVEFVLIDQAEQEIEESVPAE